MDDMDDMEHMRRALAQAATVRSITAPNPWVGCVIVPPDSAADDGVVFAGATAPPVGPTPKWPHSWRPARPPGAPPCT